MAAPMNNWLRRGFMIFRGYTKRTHPLYNSNELYGSLDSNFDTGRKRKACFAFSILSSANAAISVATARHCHTSTTETCWKCGSTVDMAKETFFCKCGVIMAPMTKLNYFQLFGLEVDFSLNEEMLSRKHKDLQRQLHPDKFTQKSEVEKHYSAEQSSLVNKAFNTLVKPLSRGLYLLELGGHPIDELSENTDLDPEFLMGIMEINEALVESGTLDSVRAIGEKNQLVLDGLLADLSEAFRQNDIDAARQVLVHLKYYANIDEKVKEFEREQYS